MLLGTVGRFVLQCDYMTLRLNLKFNNKNLEINFIFVMLLLLGANIFFGNKGDFASLLCGLQ